MLKTNSKASENRSQQLGKKMVYVVLLKVSLQWIVSSARNTISLQAALRFPYCIPNLSFEPPTAVRITIVKGVPTGRAPPTKLFSAIEDLVKYFLELNKLYRSLVRVQSRNFLTKSAHRVPNRC